MVTGIFDMSDPSGFFELAQVAPRRRSRQSRHDRDVGDLDPLAACAGRVEIQHDRPVGLLKTSAPNTDSRSRLALSHQLAMSKPGTSLPSRPLAPSSEAGSASGGSGSLGTSLPVGLRNSCRMAPSPSDQAELAMTRSPGLRMVRIWLPIRAAASFVKRPAEWSSGPGLSHSPSGRIMI